MSLTATEQAHTQHSFNPCFHGSTTVRRNKIMALASNAGFNPCFHGSTTVRVHKI
ncbi:Uncharacterized protein dnl_30570 [Desulfonema limicola]|uniref:Uncharacterized protein n=1 Tax=Desulfonema limicola TaxID=45656 RepID=A0A975GGZ3_9BACT|nr:Uncharacterized protein dnl_30570 [Desulfonema limicola]